MNRFKLIAGIALSLALVGGLAVSLLDGGDTTATPTPSAGAQSELFGVTQGIRLDDQDLKKMAATGIGEDRIQLIWGLVEPRRGSYNWAATDALIGSLASHGIRTVPFIWGSPRWVTTTTARPPIHTSGALQAWRNFLRAAALRYGQGGAYWATAYPQKYGSDATPLPIESWQVWNEPNLKKYFAPKPSVEEYARLLRASYEAIKTVNPAAQIVLAGMPGYGDRDAWDFLDNLYSLPEVKNLFDAVAIHPYAPNVEQLRAGIERVREVMKEHGAQSTPLWITEIGWGSAPPDNFGLNKGIDGQERLLSDSFELIVRQREAWNVQRVFWFDWRDPESTEEVLCSFCASAGLLRSDRTPKPAYDAYKRFALGR